MNLFASVVVHFDYISTSEAWVHEAVQKQPPRLAAANPSPKGERVIATSLASLLVPTPFSIIPLNSVQVSHACRRFQFDIQALSG